MSSQIPTLLNPSFLTSGLSTGCFNFVNKIAEARSKQEEDQIVAQEIDGLKSKLNLPEISSTKIKDYIIRLIYCDMLGHNVDFGHIHAVKLAQSAKTLWDKRTGYLACSLFLHETHELSIMLINTILKDLQSNDHLEICAALTALCHLLNPDMKPAVIGIVEDKLNHPKEIIRKKAIMVFHKLFQDDPDMMVTYPNLEVKFRQLLTRKDPHTLNALLCLYADFANPASFKDLVPILINVLEQVLDRCVSTEVGPIIIHTLKKAENGVDAAYAIIYECIRTLSQLHPKPDNNFSPFNAIARFLSSNNHNLKYLGLEALYTMDPIWWVENDWWTEEKMRILVDCLEEKDETLKKKTLDLLYKMANPQNVAVVVEHMLEALHYGDEKSLELRRHAFEESFKILENIENDNLEKISNGLKVWTIRNLGEFFECVENQDQVIDKLCELLVNNFDNCEIQSQIIKSLLKCVTKIKTCSEKILEFMTKCQLESSFGEIKQKSHEFIVLIENLTMLDDNIFGGGNNNSQNNFIYEESLAFLDEFLEEDLKNGGKPYNPISVIIGDHENYYAKGILEKQKTSEIRYEAYEKPTLPFRHNKFQQYHHPQQNLSLSSHHNGVDVEDIDIVMVNDPITSLNRNVHDDDNNDIVGYGELDGKSNQRSSFSPTSKSHHLSKSQKWSKSGYSRQQNFGKHNSSPTFSTGSNERQIKSSTDNTDNMNHPHSLLTTSASVNNAMTFEKEKVSALFSGVGTNSNISGIGGASSPPAPRKSSKIKRNSSIISSSNSQDSYESKENILNYLKPVKKTFEQFENYWASFLYERKDEVVGELAVDNVEVIKERLENNNTNGIFHIIKIIGNEAIAISQYVPIFSISDSFHSININSNDDENSFFVLLHFKIQPLHCVYTIRTNSKDIINDITQHLKPYFIKNE
ncbi:6161_t:CDS:10 [Entrophospora sp. SA101]|nr:6161_t:CDS:10 [Entrophospora sp. SA101]